LYGGRASKILGSESMGWGGGQGGFLLLLGFMENFSKILFTIQNPAFSFILGKKNVLL